MSRERENFANRLSSRCEQPLRVANALFKVV
jgi:hypothetical protein